MRVTQSAKKSHSRESSILSSVPCVSRRRKVELIRFAAVWQVNASQELQSVGSNHAVHSRPDRLASVGWILFNNRLSSQTRSEAVRDVNVSQQVESIGEGEDADGEEERQDASRNPADPGPLDRLLGVSARIAGQQFVADAATGARVAQPVMQEGRQSEEGACDGEAVAAAHPLTGGERRDGSQEERRDSSGS